MAFITQGQTNWKFIGIVAVLAVLVGVIFAWQYFWAPEKVKEPVTSEEVVPEEIIKDETANWKTYQNMNYGYEVKYPAIATGDETGNGIRINNLPIITKESNLTEKVLDIYLTDNFPEESCYRVRPDAGEPTYVTINNWKVLILRGISGGRADWSAFNARIYIPERNQCLTFELRFKYSEPPKQPPPVGNEGDTRILYQIISTLSIFEPQERYVKILSPNGGEQLTAGGKYVISWDAKNVKKIDILLTERKGEDRTYATERLIAYDLLLTDENKYEWVIPEDLPPAKYVLLISSDDGLKWVKDFSDSYFTISNVLSIQEKEKMLQEMFKGKFTIEGNEIVSSTLESYLHLYLEKIVAGSFITPHAKEHLFIVQLSGGPHTHSFLGVFDENNHFSSPAIDIDSVADFSSELHFGGDFVDFGFYFCRGITYVLTTSGGCPTGGVCSLGQAVLLKMENGKFEISQNVFKTILDIKEYKSGPWPEIRIKTEKDKILVYDWKLVDYNFNCIAPNCIGEDEFGAELRDNKKIMRLIYSGQLFWDNNECRFVEKLE